jgi:hypothetical protein
MRQEEMLNLRQKLPLAGFVPFDCAPPGEEKLLRWIAQQSLCFSQVMGR